MDEKPPGQNVVVMSVAVEGGLGILALTIGWVVGESAWDHVHFRPLDILYALLAALPPLAILLFSTVCPWGPIAELKTKVCQMVQELFGACSVSELILIAALAGWGEELLFRGVIQHFATERYGVWTGLLLASVAFGLAHPMSKAYVVLAALIGGYLGWLYLWRGNLLVPLLTHAVYDLVALLYFLRRSPQNDAASDEAGS